MEGAQQKGGGDDAVEGMSREAHSRLTVLLHDVEELDDDLGARADHHLALAGLLGVVHGVERIVEDGGADHCCGIGGRFSSRIGNEVSGKKGFIR